MSADQLVKRRPPLRMADAAMVVVLVVIVVGIVVLATTSQALPDGPAYALRFAGEQVRLAVATPVGGEQLRIQFARDRFHQSQLVAGKRRSAATRLIDDGSVYLDKAWRDLPSLSATDQRQIRDQLDVADEDQEEAQVTLNLLPNQG